MICPTKPVRSIQNQLHWSFLRKVDEIGPRIALEIIAGSQITGFYYIRNLKHRCSHLVQRVAIQIYFLYSLPQQIQPFDSIQQPTTAAPAVIPSKFNITPIAAELIGKVNNT